MTGHAKREFLKREGWVRAIYRGSEGAWYDRTSGLFSLDISGAYSIATHRKQFRERARLKRAGFCRVLGKYMLAGSPPKTFTRQEAIAYLDKTKEPTP